MRATIEREDDEPRDLANSDEGNDRGSDPLVWPLPPEQPRIKFLRAIYGAQDVEPAKKVGFLNRLAGIERKDFKATFIKPYGIATDSRRVNSSFYLL